MSISWGDWPLVRDQIEYNSSDFMARLTSCKNNA